MYKGVKDKFTSLQEVIAYSSLLKYSMSGSNYVVNYHVSMHRGEGILLKLL